MLYVPINYIVSVIYMYMIRKRQDEPNEMTIYDQTSCNELVT